MQRDPPTRTAAVNRYFADVHLLTLGESEVNNNRKLLIWLAIQDLYAIQFTTGSLLFAPLVPLHTEDYLFFTTTASSASATSLHRSIEFSNSS